MSVSPSIRRSLLLTLLTTTAVVWLVVTAVSYFDATHEVDQLFDARLAEAGRVLLDASERQRRAGDRVPAEDLADDISGELPFQVWQGNGLLALRSRNAPAQPLTLRTRGFADVQVDGVPWHVFALPSENGDLRVLVGEPLAQREARRQRIVLRLLTPLLITFPGLTLFVWIGVGQAMIPLRRIAREMTERKPQQLHPIDSSQVPVEARPLTESMNALFDRLKIAFERERRFTADAAHELRTPLAALKTHAEVALNAANDDDKTQALRQVIRGVNRAGHLVEQLLTLARLDPGTAGAEIKKLDLFIVMESLLSSLAPAALEKGIEISLAGTRGKFVEANQDALGILFRNLVDNAIRYTPESGVIEVSIKHADKAIVVSVADNGPGIPEDERDRVFKRFYRRLGNKAPGSGLGLSIVSRIAEIHHLRVELLASRHDGLQVDVYFAAEA